MDPELIYSLSHSSIWPIIEFSSISGIIIVAYIAMHSMFKSMRQPTKMLFAMLLGSLAYGLGKLFIITFLIKPVLF